MLNSIHSDFTIIVKTKKFKVHKSVLSARSPVFEKMFASNMKEAADNKVEINDIEPCTFEKLLGFMYSEKIPEDIDFYAMDLFVAADKVCLLVFVIITSFNLFKLQYEIDDLKDVCERHISLNVSKDNAMAVLNLANLYSCNYDLKKISLKLIGE